MKYIKKIQMSIKNKMFFETIWLAINNRRRVRYIVDAEIRNRIQEYRTRVFVEKRYSRILNSLQDKVDNYEDIPKVIWWCWFQGEENAPEIVRACLRSVKKFFPDFEVKIVTSENMTDFVKIPQYILDKYQNGIICAANFSDYLRNQLLLEYGGIWLDSTVYCTGNGMLEVFQRTPLFLYKDMTDENAAVSSWLIAARKGDPVLLAAKEILDDYWKKYNVSKNYYLYHIIITCISKKMEKYWKAIPFYDNCGPHVLAKEINELYDKRRTDDIKRLSDFHKLNYKVEFVSNGETNYELIVRDEYGN